LFTLSRLTRHSEVTATLAAGVSAHRMLLTVLLGATLSAAAMFGLRELVTRELGDQREALRDLLEEKRLEPVYKSLWLRDTSGNRARLAEFRPDSAAAGAPEIRGLEATLKSAGVWKKLYADRAVWRDGAWQLEGGMLEEVERSATRRPIEHLEGLEFTPRDAMTAVKGKSEPLELSFSELLSLLRRDPDNGAYQTLLQYQLTFPLANLVLLLVALPSMLGRERGKALDGVMIGLLLCVFYFCADFVCRQLGVEGALSPLLASWLPVLVFGSLGLALFDSMRT
jgi:lipopolysaccharide export system permease protein